MCLSQSPMLLTESVCAGQAVPVLHSVLIRGIHSGLLSICGCLIQALHVPIIPVDELCDFFKSDEVSVFKHSGVQLSVHNG